MRAEWFAKTLLNDRKTDPEDQRIGLTNLTWTSLNTMTAKQTVGGKQVEEVLVLHFSGVSGWRVVEMKGIPEGFMKKARPWLATRSSKTAAAGDARD